MSVKKIFLVIIVTILPLLTCYAQPPIDVHNRSMRGVEANRWEVNVKEMPSEIRAEITETMGKLKGDEQDRGIIADIGSAVGMGLVSGLVEAVVSETYNLAQYRKKQKQEWMGMIQKENNFTDSITSIKGLKDFYTANSHRGALDPSNMNFDGIEIRGLRNDQQVIYMSCSIDRSNLEHLFRHSKFTLVLDSLRFNPYVCHLPNVMANGIRTMNDLKKGKAKMSGDTILRPGKGGNGFSFDERNNLSVTIDFSLYSSWINQAVDVHKDVELGNFNFTVNIPDNIIGEYTYSRSDIIEEAEKLPKAEQKRFLENHLITIEGDCFVVPRSYMPLDNGRDMWGTGEYNLKVKIREACQFADNSEKAKHWKEDYKRLRQMQNKSGEVREYFKTLWSQYGNSLVKTSYKTAVSTAVNKVIPTSSSGLNAIKMNLGSGSANQGAGQGVIPQGVVPTKK